MLNHKWWGMKILMVREGVEIQGSHAMQRTFEYNITEV